MIIPWMLSGYRHYASLSRTDSIYGTYSIELPSSLTTRDDSSSGASRSLGTTYCGSGLNVTQVFTLNSDDSLTMLSLVTASTTTRDGGYGGYGDAPGDNTFVRVGQGIYEVTEWYRSGTAIGDIDSSTLFTTLNYTSVTSTESRTPGSLYVHVELDAYVAGAAGVTWCEYLEVQTTDCNFPASTHN